MGAKRALVTGGSRGIGRAVAAALTAVGHEVLILARDQGRIHSALAEGAAARGAAIDVTDADRIAELLAGEAPFQIVINNAGGVETAPFRNTDRAMLRRMLAVNCESAAEVTRCCLPPMVEAGFGRVVNIASTAGLKGYRYVSAYVAAKHAMVGLTRALAAELAGTGVTVNAVCPGYADTDLVRESVRSIAAKTGKSEDMVRAGLAGANPIGRLIAPAEVADAVLWLVGEGASAVTGQCIVVAGGEP